MDLSPNIKCIQLTDKSQIEPEIKNHDVHLIFLVDINLGRGKEKDGIEAIKNIKQSNPKNPVIVYTAYDVEDEVRAVGADFFFQKDAETYEKDIKFIKYIVEGLTNNLPPAALHESITADIRIDYAKCYKERLEFIEVAESLEQNIDTPLKLKIKPMFQKQWEVGKIAAQRYFEEKLTESEVKKELEMMLPDSKFEFQKCLLWLKRKVIVSASEAAELLHPFKEVLDTHIIDMYMGEINKIEDKDTAWVRFENLFTEADKSRQAFQYKTLKKFDISGLGAKFLYIFYENENRDRARRIAPLTY